VISFELKAGATLNFSGLASDSDGVPINLSGYTLTSQFRTGAGTLVGTATITPANQGTDPGEFTVSVADTVTDDWETGATVLFDIRMVSGGGTVDYTETVAIKVLAPQTVP